MAKQGFLAGRMGQRNGRPAVLVHQPDVAAVDERDLCGGDIEVAHQLGRDLGLEAAGQEAEVPGNGAG
jgi:hypothetical protein